MKKVILTFAVSLALVLAGNVLLAQGPPPPPGSGHNQSGNQTPQGGGAPLGSGIGILLALGAAYGGHKAVKAWKSEEE